MSGRFIVVNVFRMVLKDAERYEAGNREVGWIASYQSRSGLPANTSRGGIGVVRAPYNKSSDAQVTGAAT